MNSTDPHSTSYTKEELAALPQTTMVFKQPEMVFDQHTWVQQGYFVIDMCAGCPRRGIPIPAGKTLVKEGGKYKLIDELSQS